MRLIYFIQNFDVWKHIEDIAKMIKEKDPNHPVITVTAGLDVAEVKLIKKYAPSIDALGINTYGGIYHIAESIVSYGWDKPYMITEWGPNETGMQTLNGTFSARANK